VNGAIANGHCMCKIIAAYQISSLIKALISSMETEKVGVEEMHERNVKKQKTNNTEPTTSTSLTPVVSLKPTMSEIYDYRSLCHYLKASAKQKNCCSRAFLLDKYPDYRQCRYSSILKQSLWPRDLSYLNK
jgi:hypothetical protein